MITSTNPVLQYLQKTLIQQYGISDSTYREFIQCMSGFGNLNTCTMCSDGTSPDISNQSANGIVLKIKEQYGLSESETNSCRQWMQNFWGNCSLVASALVPSPRKGVSATTATAEVKKVMTYVLNVLSPGVFLIPSNLTPQRLAVLKVAVGEFRAGAHETGKNGGPFTQKYRYGVVNSNPWCASFVSWVVDTAIGKYPIGRAEASTFKARDFAIKAGTFHPYPTEKYDAKPGDLVIYRNLSGDGTGHIAFVLRVGTVRSDGFNTIGGNENDRVGIDHVRYDLNETSPRGKNPSTGKSYEGHYVEGFVNFYEGVEKDTLGYEKGNVIQVHKMGGTR